jgi:hypothetical protein
VRASLEAALEAHLAHQVVVDLEEDCPQEQALLGKEILVVKVQALLLQQQLVEVEEEVVVQEHLVQVVVLILVVQEELDYLHLFPEQQSFMPAAAAAVVNK